MFPFLKQCSMLLGLAACLSTAPQVYAAKASSIAGFIKSNRREAEIVVNTPTYDSKAKVFFLFYLGYNAHQGDKLESLSKPLIPVCKKLTGSGAELVMYLDFPPEQKNGATGNKKGKARRNAASEKRALTIKCPVINVFHSEARAALFKKDARGKEQSYGTYDLRATNAKGIPLAYFSYEKGEIMMRDATTGEKNAIGKGSYHGNEWVGPAILASYQELVEKAAPTKKSTEHGATQAENGEDAPAKIKSNKKSDKKRKNKDS